MLLLIGMNFLWAASYTFMKWGMEYMAPMHLLFARMALSVAILFVFSIGHLQKLDRRMLLRCMLLGLIIAVAHGLGNIGIDKSFAVDGALLYALEPIVAIVYARILLGERMDAARKAALLLAVAGFVILSDIQSGNIFRNTTFIGNLIMFGGVFADGLFSAVAKPAVKKHPARLVMFVTLAFATIFLAPFAALTPARHAAFTWQAAASIFYLAVICTSIGWTLWVALLKKYPVNVIAITVFLQPVVGPVISHFTLGEEISARVWFGGGIILAAVLIAVLKRKRSKDEIISEAVIH